MNEPDTKPSGGSTPYDPASLDDLVDEASRESFPCSDAPAYNCIRLGPPAVLPLSAQPRAAETPPPAQRGAPETPVSRRVRRLAGAEGLLFLVTGLWPVVHMRSFEAVTGRKQDRWLVRTVGLLLACIGGSLLATRKTRPAALLGVTTPAALAAVDIAYVAKRCIPKIYLLDAAVELGFVAAWGAMLPDLKRDERAVAAPA